MSSLLSDSLKMSVEAVNKIYKDFQAQKADRESMMKSTSPSLKHNDLIQEELAVLVQELLHFWKESGLPVI